MVCSTYLKTASYLYGKNVIQYDVSLDGLSHGDRSAGRRGVGELHGIRKQRRDNGRRRVAERDWHPRKRRRRLIQQMTAIR